MHAFKILKDRLVSTPLLQHPDPGRHAVLGQDHDGTILPVRFVGRVLQDAELYHPSEKEVLALLQVLNTCHTMITSCSEKKIRVYTPYSVLAWLFKSKTNDEDGLAAILGAGITPRECLDEVTETLVPDKGSRIKTPPVSLEMLSSDHIGHLPSWELPREMGPGAPHASSGASRIVAATGHFLKKATVNEAEYSGLGKGMQLALNAGILELVIGYTQPHLLRLLQEAEGLQAKFKSLRLVHVKRDFNAAADYISKRVIQEQSSLESNVAEEPATESGADHLESVDPGADELGTENEELAASPQNPGSQDSEEDPEDVRKERWRRICSHQVHDPGLAPLVNFLQGETERLSLRQTTHLAKIADQFVQDSRDALFYVSRNTPERPRDAADRLRLVGPQDLQEDILHHCHADFQGAHQGIIRTYERLRK
ncbi:LOW QUALITY PROTEIN: reverse transcriptase [Phytophthora megakarya]|uniref:Reverse transcriptase n=1 Tax=Phytophthora megakarya TaxID=4795 RepID=A0A225VTB5_9STRA|nr:LOW QUALITY PROTEIN: reverse transcriptase [Phytophthora megakarya]